MTTRKLSRFIFGCLLAAMVLWLPACVESFRPELGDYKNALVIDGLITDLPGPYTVLLNYSSDAYAPDFTALQGATVTIIAESGTEEVLAETKPGTYKTAENGIRGVVGEKYKIAIQTLDGKSYDSPFQELKKSIPIESVVTVVEDHFFGEEGKDVPGYQVYLNTAASDQSEDNFLWLQKGLYEYHAAYPLAFIYDGGLIPAADPYAFSICYNPHLVKEVITYSTANLDGGKIENFPLTFLRADAQYLKVRYSLLVQQLSLTQAAYDFWKNIEAQLANAASLYAVQPFQIRGNVKNTNDPDEEVLGYFTVAGMSEKRIFVDPLPGVTAVSTTCNLDPSSYRRMTRTPSTWPADVYAETGGGLYYFDNGCIDCRKSGGVIEKPDFW